MAGRRPSQGSPLQRPDAIVLLTLLGDPATVRLLGESWFWRLVRVEQRSRSARGRKAVRLALLHAIDHRLNEAPLTWPGSRGPAPSLPTHALYLSAAWLLGEVELPGNGGPCETWTPSEIAELATAVLKEVRQADGLPWGTLVQGSTVSSRLAEERKRYFGGGRLEVVSPPKGWSESIAALEAIAA